MKRRKLVATTGCALSFHLAGCLGSGPGAGERSEPVEEWEYDVSESTPSLTFDEVGRDDHSLAVHVTSAEEAEAAFAYESSSGDAQHGVATFIEETDFETAMLFYVETRAPNGCHGLRVQSLEISDDNILIGSVESREPSGDGECPAVVTTPSRLVRVTAAPGLPSHASLDVTDGWGATEQVTSSGVDAD